MEFEDRVKQLDLIKEKIEDFERNIEKIKNENQRNNSQQRNEDWTPQLQQHYRELLHNIPDGK
jgi:hypothetical protein